MEETKSYIINPELCTGCGKCITVCDDHAIQRVNTDACAKCMKYCSVFGNNVLACTQNKMCIDVRACTGCGRCLEVCPEDAIVLWDNDGVVA